MTDLIYENDEGGDWFEPGPHYDGQWWIGATCHGEQAAGKIVLVVNSSTMCSGDHSSHQWGNWTWDMSHDEVSADRSWSLTL